VYTLVTVATSKKRKSAKTTTLVTFRASDDLLALLDAEVERLRTGRPGEKVSRANAIRATLGAALSRPKR